MYYMSLLPITIYLLYGKTNVRGTKYNQNLPEVFEYKDKQENNKNYANNWKRPKVPFVGGNGDSVESTTYGNTLVGVQSNYF